MVQVLCYTSRGFDTCWRPGNIATHVAIRNTVEGHDYTPIRFA